MSSSLIDRLRGIAGSNPRRGVGEAGPEASALTPRCNDEPGGSHDVGRSHAEATAEALGGHWHEADGRRVLVVDRVYRPGHRHGRLALIDHLLPDDDAWCDVLLTSKRAPGDRRAGERQRALFVDLETTGLAGGAGTYAFLVGCAWFEGPVFRVRQFFMSSLAAERAMLEALVDVAATASLVVTFNGKTFDLPLIETRYQYHRRDTPFAAIPHLDMLHPARRLWRAEEDEREAGGCRLSTLEETLCGHTREGDVPGFEIPARYFHYVRSGDARPLEPVLEHNRLDLLSLAFLTSRAAHLVDDGAASLRTAREAVGLGRLYERSGEVTHARRCFARASGLDGSRPLAGHQGTIAEAVHAYAALCRRERHYADAAAAWRRLLEMRECPDALLRDASEALAVYHEHRLRDPRAARAFAIRSAPLQSTATRRQALQHRLARLEQKLSAEPLALF